MLARPAAPEELLRCCSPLSSTQQPSAEAAITADAAHHALGCVESG